MVTDVDKSLIIAVFDRLLGTGYTNKSQRIYHCPFCHHRNPKLEINLDKQYWHCWVCDSSGRSLYKLLKRLDAPDSDFSTIKRVYGTYRQTSNLSEVVNLSLPKEYLPLWVKPTNLDVNFNVAKKYLNGRGISDLDIMRYSIGYASSGSYSGRIIVPSYGEDGKLNYFVSRSYWDNEPMKYKNPPITKNIIGFESTVNWKLPVTLVEGVFDAISVGRNVIPLMGKSIPKVLMDKLVYSTVPGINLMLDIDAMKHTLSHAEYLIKRGVSVKIIQLPNKDPGEMSRGDIISLINSTQPTEWDSLVKLKLSQL